LKPSQISEALEVLVKARRPAFVWGSPGIGKSDVVRQVARKLDRNLIDIRAVLLDPVDLRGLPHVNGGGKAHWAIPEFLPRDGSGILFLDELPRAPQLDQNACLQLVLDRQIGEYTLPDGWDIISAGNRITDGGGSFKLNSALSSRFIHLDAEVDLDDFCKWGVKANIDPVILAFVRFRTELLCKFDASAKNFPCPRSYEFLSQIVACNPSPAIELDLYKGAIGDGAAIEFASFLKLYRNLPSIDAILLDPKHAPCPKDDPASLFAVSCALARRAGVDNLKAVITYLDRLPEEYSVMCIKDAIARESTLASTGEFTKWAIAHADVVF